jgi:hypothetical protein
VVVFVFSKFGSDDLLFAIHMILLENYEILLFVIYQDICTCIVFNSFVLVIIHLTYFLF